jgi:glycosidase
MRALTISTATRLLAALTVTLAAAPADADAARATACRPAPFGEAVLHLRGAHNNWTASDEGAFSWACDAYRLNVDLQGRVEFKIADEAWTHATTFEAGPRAREGGPGDALKLHDGNDPKRAGNLAFRFQGPHTLTLRVPAGRRGAPTLTLGPRTFVNPDARVVSDPAALGVRHDSRDPAHKSPFGATPAGTSVRFAIDAPEAVRGVTLVIERRVLEGNQDVLAYLDPVRLPMRRDPSPAGAAKARWSVEHQFAAKGVHGYHFEVDAPGGPHIYQNNSNEIFWTRERGSNGVGVIAHPPARARSIRRFRHTVHDPAFQVPDWAQDTVYYSIFPERFRNGDPTNDPKVGRRTYQNRDIEVHVRWAGAPWRPGSGDGSDDAYNNDFFGGDLAGVIEKLDHVRALGANAIYMTPVFTAASNHKYDTADFHQIDPAFGTIADFERLTREAQGRGIRIIPDTSLNHVGADSVYFDRWAKHPGLGAFESSRIQTASPFADWFSFDATQTVPDRQFKGWTGVTDLPELDKRSASFRRFSHGDANSVMKVWLDRGAAGWRMDVAPWVPDDFWREWRAAIKTHRPDALTIAETWFDSSKYFLGDMFDSTMNYILRDTLINYVNGGDARALWENVEMMREVYPRQSFHALMNLISSHDRPRALHLMGGTSSERDPARVASAKRRLKLATFMQMVLPGSPSIYYGDEVGMTGGDDPFNRGPFPWADTGGSPDLDMLATVKALVAMRHAHPVLRRGDLLAPLHLDERTIVLARAMPGAWAVVATNAAEAERTIEATLPAGFPDGAWRDALSGETAIAAGGRLRLRVPALSGVALMATRP